MIDFEVCPQCGEDVEYIEGYWEHTGDIEFWRCYECGWEEIA